MKGVGDIVVGVDTLRRQVLEHQRHRFAGDRETLRNRRSRRQNALETLVGPGGGKQDSDRVEAIGIDHAGQRAERQVVAIDRMRGEQRIAGFEFDGPEAVELDQRAAVAVASGEP